MMNRAEISSQEQLISVGRRIFTVISSVEKRYRIAQIPLSKRDNWIFWSCRSVYANERFQQQYLIDDQASTLPDFCDPLCFTFFKKQRKFISFLADEFNFSLVVFLHLSEDEASLFFLKKDQVNFKNEALTDFEKEILYSKMSYALNTLYAVFVNHLNLD